MTGCDTEEEIDYYLEKTPKINKIISFTHPRALCIINASLEVIYDSVSYSNLTEVTSSYNLTTGSFEFETDSETYLSKTLIFKINATAFT